MQFGQKRERFEGDPNQTELPFEAAPAEVEQQQQEINAHNFHIVILDLFVENPLDEGKQMYPPCNLP